VRFTHIQSTVTLVRLQREVASAPISTPVKSRCDVRVDEWRVSESFCLVRFMGCYSIEWRLQHRYKYIGDPDKLHKAQCFLRNQYFLSKSKHFPHSAEPMFTTACHAPLLNEMKPVLAILSYCFIINFSIIFPSTPGPSSSFLQVLPPNLCMHFWSHTCVPHATSDPCFHHRNDIWRKVQITDHLLLKMYKI
jgi:hypothetical protein